MQKALLTLNNITFAALNYFLHTVRLIYFTFFPLSLFLSS